MSKRWLANSADTAARLQYKAGKTTTCIALWRGCEADLDSALQAGMTLFEANNVQDVIIDSLRVDGQNWKMVAQKRQLPFLGFSLGNGWTLGIGAAAGLFLGWCVGEATKND